MAEPFPSVAPLPADATARRPRTRVLLTAVLAVVLLGADASAMVVLRRPPVLVGVSGARNAELTAILRWVERQRHLPLRHDLRVKVLSQADFTAAIRNDGVDPNQAADDRAKAAQAEADTLFLLGIADRHYDANVVADVHAEGVVGSYDQHDKVLSLPDVPLTPFRREVIAHELTHALDDQHFGLDRKPRRLVDESSLAFRALAEGDANDVERAYVAAMSATDRDAAKAESDGAGASADREAAVPDGVLAIFGFPYSGGQRFVRALRDAGGNARVDQAFRVPPRTTEEILHPERFGNEAPVAVTRPKPAGGIVDRGVLGELGLRIVLVTYGDHDTGIALSAGWSADRYVSYTSTTGAVCLRSVIRMDTVEQTSAVAGILQQWKAGRADATVAVTPVAGSAGEIDLDACTPR